MDIKGITFKDVASDLGISPTAVRNWIVGKVKPREKYIDSLANSLDVSEDFLREHLTFVTKITRNCDKKRSRAAVTYTDTFWSKKRVESGLTLKEVAEAIGCTHKTTAAFFTGRTIPSDDIIARIASLFDVDVDEATTQFYRAHRGYKPVNVGRNLVASAKKPKKAKSTKVKPVKVEPVKVNVEPTIEPCNNQPSLFDKVREALYGNISYEEFKNIESLLDDGFIAPEVVKETLYGKVDYEIFTIVCNIIDDRI